MAHMNDFVCDRCGEFCSTVVIDGKTVPLVVYLVAGKPPDFPGEFDLNAPGIRVPEFIRSLMALPVPRIEWCVKCFAEEFGLELVEADRRPREKRAGDLPPARSAV